MSRRSTQLRSVRNGAVAGIVGTAAMDLLWYARYRRGGGTDGPLAWEFSAGTESYDDAGAPAQVGRKLVRGLTGVEPDPSTARHMNNLVHWATGIGWGLFHGLLAGSGGRTQPRASRGLGTGAVAFAASYALLAPAKIYKPIWEYPPSVLGKDLSAHLLYGLATGLAFRGLSDGAAGHNRTGR